MATIVKTQMRGPGQRTVTETTLGASNDFVYAPGNGEILILRNPTAGAVASVIDGAGATSKAVPGVGNVDLSAGYSVGSIPAGGVRAIPLDTIGAYLEGAISITGTGLVAALLTF
jgi:hypothetical protein